MNNTLLLALCQYAICYLFDCLKLEEIFVPFYQVFENLCNEKGVSPTKAARDVGVAQPVVSQWKKRGSTPKAETVQKLANYLGVSTEDLLAESKHTEAVINYLKDKIVEIVTPPTPSLESFGREWAYVEKKLRTGVMEPEERGRYLSLIARGDILQIVAAAKTALPECMEQLNDIGQQLVEDYANDLIKIPEYRRSDAQRAEADPASQQ